MFGEMRIRGFSVALFSSAFLVPQQFSIPMELMTLGTIRSPCAYLLGKYQISFLRAGSKRCLKARLGSVYSGSTLWFPALERWTQTQTHTQTQTQTKALQSPRTQNPTTPPDLLLAQTVDFAESKRGEERVWVSQSHRSVRNLISRWLSQ